jgi:hypothetical protein
MANVMRVVFVDIVFLDMGLSLCVTDSTACVPVRSPHADDAACDSDGTAAAA